MIFFQIINKFNRNYPVIFEETDGEGDEERTGESERATKGNRGSQSNIWFLMIEQVSDLTKLNWNEVYSLSAVEFMNYATIAKIKILKHNEQVRKTMRRYGK